jgi:hypothetical protein
MRSAKSVLGLSAVLMLVVALQAQDDRAPRKVFGAVLKGANESPLTLSGGSGHLRLSVSDDESSVHFVLEFTGLQTTVLFSHIHVGQPNINGAVTVFFCGGNGTQPCPQEGIVEGDFTANDVIGLTPQQLEPNNLQKLLAAIRAGETYANVHTMDSPGGEIRGQIQAVRRGDKED